MALDGRSIDLLQRFPDELSAEEEAELRRLAEQSPVLAALVEEIAGLDAALDRPPTPAEEDLSGGFTLSELGRRRLDRELRDIAEGGGLGQGRAEAIPPRRRSLRVWGVVAAAGLLLGLGLLLRTAPDVPPTDLGALQARGEGDTVKAELVVLGPSGPLGRGAAQDPSTPVQLQVVASGAAHLAMLESQGGRTMMLYPVPGMQWSTEGGVTTLQPPGQSADYRPAGPGRAEYHLLIATGPFRVPEGPVALDEIAALARGAQVADSFTVDWRAP